MSSLLNLARDYVERMANPVHGAATNEDYANHFARLLEDETFERRLNQEIAQLEDPDALTSYGWLWLFGWARARDIKLHEGLLTDLFERWGNVFVRAIVIDLATRYDASQDHDLAGMRPDRLPIGEFRNRFLAHVMTVATEGTAGEDEALLPFGPEVPVHWGRAEATLLSLLQVGSPLTLDAAATLLRDRWPGQGRVLEVFWAWADTLDEETRSLWVDRLSPPRRAG